MDRRSFLKIAAASGLAVAAPLGARRGLALPEPYEGPCFVFLDAGGGWDPVYLCDPKPPGALNRLYDAPGKLGALAYAPVVLDAAALGLDAEQAAHLMSPQHFFEKHGPELLVLNGLDMATNNHDSGVRAIGSGRVEEGYPSLGALVAAARSPGLPLAYLSAGGHDATEGLVPLTRVAGAGALRRVAFPNQTDPDEASTATYHSSATAVRIRKAQDERLAARMQAARLPRIRSAIGELQLARDGDHLLRDLVLPEPVSLPGNRLSDLEALMQQAQLAVAAFEARLAVAVNLHLGGFDTHANHDTHQLVQIGKLLHGIDYLRQLADAAGIAGRLTIVIGSDFARGPGYNGDDIYAGKDHWSISSAMLIGSGITGGRVVGATDDAQLAVPIDPVSLAPAEDGAPLTPASLHRALRALAGVDGSDAAKRFPLGGVDVPRLLSG